MAKNLINLDLYRNNISMEKLFADEQRIVIKPGNSYFISYREFTKYFAGIKKLSLHNVIIGINFTYGWMPTAFDFRSKKFKKVLQILNSAKQNHIPNKKELLILKSCFNNSLIGTSKLLHFINPVQFAIWDGRVFRYLTGMKPYTHRVEKIVSYLDYLNFCTETISDKRFLPIHKSLQRKVGYRITPMRSIELVMFLNGGTDTQSGTSPISYTRG